MVYLNVPSLENLYHLTTVVQKTRSQFVICRLRRERMSEATVPRYFDLMFAPSVRGAMIARIEPTTRHGPLHRLMQAPTMLNCGEKDTMIQISNPDEYLKALTNAKLADLGHLPHEGAPIDSLLPLRAFLDRE